MDAINKNEHIFHVQDEHKCYEHDEHKYHKDEVNNNAGDLEKILFLFKECTPRVPFEWLLRPIPLPSSTHPGRPKRRFRRFSSRERLRELSVTGVRVS